MRPLTINRARLEQTWSEIAQIGALPGGGVTRLALSDEDRAARDLLVRWLEETGLAVRVDDVGNVVGRWEGADPTAPVLLVGSHLDSVVRAGRFDGVLGVLAALEVVRSLRDAGLRPHHPIEVVDFTAEEGARFQPAMLASGVLVGHDTAEYAHSRRDARGRSFGEELARIGYLGLPEHRPGNVGTFLELHVEQGPVLEAEGYAVGAVDALVGALWLEVTVVGESDHAGPTPMHMRRDALVAAAQMITAIEALAGELAPDAVTTVGRLAVEPNVINVIPGRVVFTIDTLHRDAEVLERGASRVQEIVEAIAAKRGVQGHVSRLWMMSPTVFDPGLVAQTEAISARLGFSCRRICGGCGHDAKYLAEIAPATVVFVPSIGGKSHCPEELSSWEDIERGVTVLLHLVAERAGIE